MSKFFMNYSNLAQMMISKIPQKVLKSKDTTFYDRSMGRGQIVLEIEKTLKEYGHSISSIAKRMFGYGEHEFETVVAKKEYKLVGKYFYNGGERVKMDFKPTVTITNPAYSGTEQLHQQSFNKDVQRTVDGGYVVYIQPATTYLTQKKYKRHEAIMAENVLKYKTDVYLLDPSIFEGAYITNDLSITVLHKVKNTTGKLNSITYKNGERHENVDLNDISMTGIDPNIYGVIRNKYEAYVNKHGCLEDLVNKRKLTNNVAGLPQIRGNMGSADFFTFMPSNPKDTKYYTNDVSEKFDFGIKVKNNKQIKNVYSYLQTYVARFGLALTKITFNHNRKTLVRVPLVDFNKNWTDDMLIKEIGLTQKEVKLIKNFLGNYHGH